MIIALSGVVNIFQPLIDAMNHKVFHDNPIPINVVLASLGSVIGTSLVLYVSVQGKKVMREQAAQESEWERNRMIREDDESDYTEF